MSTLPSPLVIDAVIQPGILLVDDEQDFARGVARLLTARFTKPAC